MKVSGFSLALCAALAVLAARAARADMNRWTTQGPNGGQMTTLVYSPDGRTVYAGTAFGGVFASEDDGDTWRPMNEGLGDLHVYSIALDPNNSRIVYAGTLRGAFRSMDGGEHWIGSSKGMKELTAVFSIAVDPGHPETVLAGTNGDDIFRSTDGGKKWTEA